MQCRGRTAKGERCRAHAAVVDGKTSRFCRQHKRRKRTKMSQCEGITIAGGQCRQTASHGSRYCIWHDPEHPERADAARRKGARNAKAKRQRVATADEVPGAAPKTAAEAQEWASWLILATATGKLDRDTSQKVSTALTVFLRAIHVATMEEKIRELQAQVKALKKGGPNG